MDGAELWEKGFKRDRCMRRAVRCGRGLISPELLPSRTRTSLDLRASRLGWLRSGSKVPHAAAGRDSRGELTTVPRLSYPHWRYAAHLVIQTAEQLNQLTRLSETHPQLVFRAEEAKRRILRPPLTEGINLETA